MDRNYMDVPVHFSGENEVLNRQIAGYSIFRHTHIESYKLKEIQLECYILTETSQWLLKLITVEVEFTYNMCIYIYICT